MVVDKKRDDSEREGDILLPFYMMDSGAYYQRAAPCLVRDSSRQDVNRLYILSVF